MAKPAEAIDIAEILASLPPRIHQVMDLFAEHTPDQPALVETAGGAALIVPRGNAPALAQAIEALLNDQELYLTLSNRGIARVNDFALNRVGEQYVQFLETLVRRA